MLHKVVALDTYERLKVADKNEGHVKEGTIFEVDDERLNVLLGNNYYKVPFVKVFEEPTKVVAEEPIEKSTEAVAEEPIEKPKRRGRKKKE